MVNILNIFCKGVKNRILLASLSLIVILVLIQLPNRASAQAVFMNYGVTFIYPQGWLEEDREDTSHNAIFIKVNPAYKPNISEDNQPGYILVTISVKDHRDIKTYLRDLTNKLTFLYTNFNRSTLSNTTIAGTFALSRTFTVPEPGLIIQGEQYAFKRGDNIYSISLYVEQPSYNYFVPIFRNIISSFEFTH